MLKDGADLEIRSLNNRELTAMYPQVVAAGAKLKAKTAVVDSEIVALGAKGRSSFQVLQHRSAHAGHHIVFYAFDLLYFDGADLTGQPLSFLRAKLTAVLRLSRLLLSYHTGSRLMFAGKVRAGFVPHVRRQLSAKLKALHVEQCHFMNLPDSKSSRWGGGVMEHEMGQMQWVKPQLVVQIRFVEWTAEGRLRHAVYVGERTDKPARSVTREAPLE